MKKKFTKYSLFGTVFVFLVVLGCKQDDFYNEEANSGFNEKGLKIRTLKGNDAQKVADRFKNGVLNSIGFSVQPESGVNFRTTNSGSGTINYDEILEVIDTLGNTNYTFRVEGYPEQDEKSFFNLIVNEKEGEQKALLFKYEMSDEFFQEYNSGNKTIEMFQGTLNIYNLDTGTNPLDGPANPCGEDIIIDFDQYPGGNQDATYPVYPNPGNSNPTNPINPGGIGGANTGGLTVSDNIQIHFVCNSSDCGFTTNNRADLLNHYAPKGFTMVFTFSKTLINPNASEDPCGEDIGAVGVLTPEENHEKNCQELKKLKTDTKIKQTYNTLQSNASDITKEREYGYSYAIGSTPAEVPLANGNPTELAMPVGGLIYGGSHTHPPKVNGEVVFPMFSVSDIYKLGEMYVYHSNPDVEKDPSIFFFSLTVKKGYSTETFVLKIENWIEFAGFCNQYYNMTKKEKRRLGEKLNRIYDRTFDSGGGLSNYLTDMFKFMSAENINGVSVYQATDNNFSDWKKLTYNPATNNIDETNCN